MKDIFLLDMDDTLLDFARAEREGILYTFRKTGVPATDDTAKRFHDINDSLWKALERGEITREQIVYRRFEMLFGELGVASDPRAAADIYFEALACTCFPFDGMEEFLKELKKRGRIYIVTNGSAYIQRRHLTDGRILPYADGVFISEEMGVYKPSQAYCDCVKERIPMYDGAKAVYLGDSLTADKPCAERLGAQFVRYLPRDAEGEGVKSYREFLHLIFS